MAGGNAKDFLANIGATQSPGKGHNFLEDPASNAPKDGGKDFSAEAAPEQKNIDHSTGGGSYDPSSVPAGGTFPYPMMDPKGELSREDNPITTDGPKPFKNLR